MMSQQLYESIETRDEQTYRGDIVEHMHDMEQLTKTDVNMIDMQPELEWFMRPYLMDFLLETHASFGLQPATLYLAVNLVDRYCSRRIVYRRHYQLVGCTALWVAAKYEEKKDRVPGARELRQISCNAYDENMFIQMERHVLNTLEWTVGHPTAYAFQQLAKLDCAPHPQLDSISQFFCEMAFYHRSFQETPASRIASASLLLAQHILGLAPPPLNSKDTETVVQLQQHLPFATQILLKKYAGISSILQAFSLRRVVPSSYPPTPPPGQDGATGDITPATLDSTDVDSVVTSCSGILTPPLTPTAWRLTQ